MCGIVGIFGERRAYEQLKLALTIMKNRGKDGMGIASNENVQYHKQISRFSPFRERNLLGHLLHSIVGSVSQPLKKEGTLVVNCEIYNWKELAAEYGFKVRNDAELLLYLFDAKGVSSETLKKLDGVYSFAYWKEDKIYLSRDLLGVKPLWYYYNEEIFSFASEKKALEQIGYVDVQELNPRQILIYDVKKKRMDFQLKDFLTYLPEIIESKEEIMTTVEQARNLLKTFLPYSFPLRH